jgi:hypothetical protein
MSNPMSVTRRPVLQRDGTETADDIPEFVTGPDGGHYGHFHAAAGVIALLTSFTSANLAAALSDETGGGAGAVAVFSESPTFSTQITISRDIAAAATADGLILTNPHAVDAVNTAQRTPRVLLQSNVYDSDDAVTRVSGWRIEGLPISGTTIQGQIKFSHRTDAGAFSDDFTSIAGGTFTKIAGNIQLSAGALVARRDGIGTTSTDGTLLQNATLSLVGTPVQYGPRSRHVAHVFNTSTVLDETREVITELRPVSGSSTSFSYVIARGSGDVAGATDLLTVLSSGGITALGGVAGSGVFTATRSSIGATSTAGFLARNPTAALVGTQHQWAPRIERTGTVWDGAASRAVGWIDEVQTTAGASYRGDLVFSYSANGAAYGESVRFRADNMSVFSTPAQGATTPTGGLQIVNATAAANGAQQFSGMLVLTGQGWDTTAGASKPVDFCMQVEPSQFAGNPPANLVFYRRQNNGAWASVLTLGNGGALNAASTITAGTGITATTGNVTASAGQVVGQRTNIATTNFVAFNASNSTAATSGVPVQQSPDFYWIGAAYNNVSTLSEAHEWRSFVLPATAAGTTSSTWKMQRQINGGGYSDMMTVSSAGSVGVTGSVVAGGGFFCNTNGFGTTSTDGLRLSNGAASTVGTPVQQSSRFRWSGTAWETTGGTSQIRSVSAELRPTSGATSNANWVLFRDANDASGSADILTININSALLTTHVGGGLSAGSQGVSTTGIISSSVANAAIVVSTSSSFFQKATADALNTSVLGFLLRNTTAATSSAAANLASSGYFEWRGNGWDDTVTQASVPVASRLLLRPLTVTGATSASMLVFQFNVNNAGTTEMFKLSSQGWMEFATATVTPPTPGAGSARLFYDGTNFKYVNSAGTVKTITAT